MKLNLDSLEALYQELFKILTKRGKEVLSHRYGLFSVKNEPETLESIGQRYHITRERVRQIEADSLRRLCLQREHPLFQQWAGFLNQVFGGYGDIIAEHILFEDPFLGKADARQGHALIFLLRLSDGFVRRKEDDYMHAHWTSRLPRAEQVVRVLRDVARKMETSTPVSEDEICGLIRKQLGEDLRPSTVLSYLSLSKKIAKNKWNEYGHVTSPLIRPRGMKDGAYIVLSRHQRPLHFSEISRVMQEQVFSAKRIHVQTVHNELIKDPRFVLVGRGLYALSEWGYEPGFVKDIICGILKQQGACKREMIVAEVLKRRQVKENTIIMNLNNKEFFVRLPNGKYTLVA